MLKIGCILVCPKSSILNLLPLMVYPKVLFGVNIHRYIKFEHLGTGSASAKEIPVCILSWPLLLGGAALTQACVLRWARAPSGHKAGPRISMPSQERCPLTLMPPSGNAKTPCTMEKLTRSGPFALHWG